jgi:hypothetical protein
MKLTPSSIKWHVSSQSLPSGFRTTAAMTLSQQPDGTIRSLNFHRFGIIRLSPIWSFRPGDYARFRQLTING